ncbi:hypothetical protein M9H77_20064 [Catharanthus roseus]|uniref:Uncharacterized protein n=1 Tax=Catharanthus roseus TaxID=4058 RepID=A0ACC0AJF8_CATRO|nr:hypothetical protein M9H77_20064 [Catharanthus roseus]
MVRSPSIDKDGLKRGLKRCGKSCRLRWLNYLKPGLKKGSFSKEEEEMIIKLHDQLGNRWSAIAAKLPGRTDNEIKNYWNSYVRKSVRKDPQAMGKTNEKSQSEQELYTDQQMNVAITASTDDASTTELFFPNVAITANTNDVSTTTELFFPDTLIENCIISEDKQESQNEQESYTDQQMDVAITASTDDASTTELFFPSTLIEDWIISENNQEFQNEQEINIDQQMNIAITASTDDASTTELFSPTTLIEDWIISENEQESQNEQELYTDQQINVAITASTDDASTTELTFPNTLIEDWIILENGINLDESFVKSFESFSIEQPMLSNASNSLTSPSSSSYCSSTVTNLYEEESYWGDALLSSWSEPFSLEKDYYDVNLFDLF